MDTPFVVLRKIKIENDDRVPRPARKRSMSAKLVEMDLTIDCVMAENSDTLEQTKNDEKSDQSSVRPKAPRGRPKKSQLKAITSGQESMALDTSNAGYSVKSGNQTLDSSSTFVHSKETSNVKLNSRKRKSENTIPKSTLDFNSPEKNSTHNFLGTQHNTLLKPDPSKVFLNPAGQPTRFNFYMALPDDPVRARQWSAKDWDVTLLQLLPKCVMSLKIRDPTTIIMMAGCIEVRYDTLASSCISLESNTKPLEIDAGRLVQIGNMGSEVATFQTIMAMDHIFLPEDNEQPVRFNAYKARPSDPVNAQQLVSDEDVRISWIHLQPKGYLPIKIHDPTTIVLVKGRIEIIKDITIANSTFLSSMESIEIKPGNLIHVANLGYEVAKFQTVEFLK